MNSFYEQPEQSEYYQKEDYTALLQALEECKSVRGLGCEVGVREGHGSYLMMKHGPPNRVHVCVDPYGNIEYKSWEVRSDRLNEYNDAMFYATMQHLYAAAEQLQRHLIFFPLEDTEFQTRFGSGVPVYTRNEKRVLGTYAIVHIDGPHTTAAVLHETKFFMDRMERGGCLVYDDIQQYDHGAVDACLLAAGFLPIHRTQKKAAYCRKQ
jgi:hypothetical protein